MDIQESILYTAATDAIVSDTTGENCFEKLIKGALAFSAASDYKAELKAVEQVIKSEFGITKMPSPWRSGKSVVINSMELGVPLVDDNGVPYGKTTLQLAIKAERSVTKEESETEFDRCYRFANEIAKHWHSLTIEEQSRLRVGITAMIGE